MSSRLKTLQDSRMTDFPTRIYLAGESQHKMNVAVEIYSKLSSHKGNVCNKTGYYGILLQLATGDVLTEQTLKLNMSS